MRELHEEVGGLCGEWRGGEGKLNGYEGKGKSEVLQEWFRRREEGWQFGEGAE